MACVAFGASGIEAGAKKTAKYDLVDSSYLFHTMAELCIFQ
jgi:hypothetical protein